MQAERMRKSTCQGDAIEAVLDSSTLYKFFDTFRNILDALVQLLENSDDYGSKNIIVRVADGKIVVADDGQGMDEEGKQSACSIGKSRSARDKKKKGRNGTGMKAIVVNMCRTMHVETKHTSDEDLCCFTITRSGLEELIRQRGVSIPQARKDLSYPHDIKTTGTVITLEDFDKGKFPDPETLIEKLGEKLLPLVAAKITINGKSLKPRELHGKRIQRSVQHPVLGTITVDLAIVTKSTTRDKFTIGAMGPVMEMAPFLHGAVERPRFRNRIPGVMFDNRIVGFIDVPAFNDPYALHGRTGGFSSEIYDSREFDSFVTWLLTDLADDFESQLGLQEKDSDNKEAMARELQDLVDAINDKTGYVPKEVATDVVKVFYPNISYVELEPGELCVFRLMRSQGFEFRWQPASSGGTLDTTTGRVVAYTAGRSTGRYVLRVSSVKPEYTVEIRISIVDEKKFKISPSTTELLPGTEVVLRVKKTERTSGRFRWSAEDSGGRIRSGTSDQEVVYVAGKEPGRYSVIVMDKENPDISARCVIDIVEKKSSPPKREDKKDAEIVANAHVLNPLEISIRGVVLVITHSHFGGSRTSRIVRGENRHSLWFNTKHPAFIEAKRCGAFALYHLHEIALAVGLFVAERDQAEVVEDYRDTIAGEVLSELLSDNGKK